jgi:hypothetical protein
MQRLYNQESVLELNNKSCEMIAEQLYSEINNKYPGRHVRISVAEDNENGCEIDFPIHSRPVGSFVSESDVNAGC